ncbi:MAG: hypothetical protein NC311_04105 [Muribaculaceae bacterium]|nr:hypothetical protein [Muribaculaceae bacterium]
MHAAMKYVILNTIQNNNIIMRENDTTGFTTYVILDKNNKHLMTVYYNWKYQNFFVHTANDQTVTEGKIPNSRYAMISKHHYDLQDIVNACFKKAHNIPHAQPMRRPVSQEFLNVAAGKMWDAERARFNLLQKSVNVK